MTVAAPELSVAAWSAAHARARRYCLQAAVVMLINVPTVSSGLSLGWVSLASGENADSGGGSEVVLGAAVTFLASLVGVPLSARALAAGRKVAVIGTSVAFLVCWALTLCGGGWWLVCARAAAGLGGAGAWAVAPLLAQEMCEEAVRGAAVAALVLAHNLGFLLMYVAAATGIHHRTVVWWCAALSVIHCGMFLLVPESPAFLAANGRTEEARSSLACLRGEPRDSAALDAELAALPPSEPRDTSPLQLVRDMLRDRCRRRAFWIAAVCVVGQEMCGVLTLLQFAERVFVLARDGDAPTAPPASVPIQGAQAGGVAGAFTTPAGHAVLLGAVQFIASAFALYLVEKVGRRRLLVWAAVVTGAALGGGAGAAWWSAGGTAVGVALAVAVAADSAGLQPAPYALLADLFDYQYRGCAMALVTAGSCAANALEVLGFAWVTSAAGLAPALLLAALLTLALAAFAAASVPETRGRPLAAVYRELSARRPRPPRPPRPPRTDQTRQCSEIACTKV